MTDSVHPDRLAKLDRIREAGRDPFPARGVQKEAIASVRESSGTAETPGSRVGERVTVAGRAMGLRDFGKLIFLRVCISVHVVLLFMSGRVQQASD